MTWAPNLASSKDMAAPIPLEAPVTSAIFPSKVLFLLLKLHPIIYFGIKADASV